VLLDLLNVGPSPLTTLVQYWQQSLAQRSFAHWVHVRPTRWFFDHWPNIFENIDLDSVIRFAQRWPITYHYVGQTLATTIGQAKFCSLYSHSTNTLVLHWPNIVENMDIDGIITLAQRWHITPNYVGPTLATIGPTKFCSSGPRSVNKLVLQ